MTDIAMLSVSGYVRRENDAYFTPAWVTCALLDRINFRGLVWEPACGDGAIAKVLHAYHYDLMLSDICDYGFPCARADFLFHGSPGDGAFSICTNPPYDKAEKFVRHALHLTSRSGGMVAMLLRHEWDCAQTRRDLFEQEAFAKKITLTKRPRWFADERASPRHNFAWFVWDWNHSGKPTLEWGP